MSWITSMLSDGTNNSISSKRVVTLIAFLLCSVAFVAELFWGLDVQPHTLDNMMYIVLGGLGFTASEKFSKESK